MNNNMTIMDFFGGMLAFVVAISVYVAPGYIIGQVFNLFEFRQRTYFVRNVIGSVLSNAIFPILAYLTWQYTNATVVLVLTLACLIAWAGFQIAGYLHKRGTRAVADPYRRFVLILAVAWVIFSLLLIIDIQIGHREYFATVAYDYTTRIPVIDTITRTGIPPVNPGYYPGHSTFLTFLYYYWYISPSLVDMIGGDIITARHAMFAGVAWAGLIVMATIGLYLRLRNNTVRKVSWTKSILGIQFLAISGLDFLPVTLFSISTKLQTGTLPYNGMIEGWNMPVMSWLNAFTWVPNHVSAAMACFAALLVILWAIEKDVRARIIATCVAGLACASAFGASVWVMLTFAIAWVIFAFILILRRRTRPMWWCMVLAGIFGILLSIPFIRGVLTTGNAIGSGGSPVTFYVRSLGVVEILLVMAGFPPVIRYFIHALLLPLNYLLELGLFFAVIFLWIKNRKVFSNTIKEYQIAEVVILITVAIMLSFLGSTVIAINDWGIRGWLLAQFVLLIWASDLLSFWIGDRFPSFSSIYYGLGTLKSVDKILRTLFIVGLLTTLLEAFATRAWPILVDTGIAGFPNDLSPDTNLGERTFSARQAYDFIDSNLPQDVIIQNNPYVSLDRPSGLYNSRQMVITDRLSYGVSLEDFERLANQTGGIFESTDLDSWDVIDAICRDFSINVIVVNDLDPIWGSLDAIGQQRAPLYADPYYAVFYCGIFHP